MKNVGVGKLRPYFLQSSECENSLSSLSSFSTLLFYVSTPSHSLVSIKSLSEYTQNSTRRKHFIIKKKKTQVIVLDTHKERPLTSHN